MIKPWFLQQVRVFMNSFFRETLFLLVLMHNQEEIGLNNKQKFLNIERKYSEMMTQMVKRNVTQEVVLVTCLVFALKNCQVKKKFALPLVLKVF